MAAIALILSLRTIPAFAAEGGPDSDCCYFTVSGNVWYDQNANGLMDGGEPPLAGWTIEYLDSNLVVITTTTTNALGQYTFSAPTGCGYPFKLRQVMQSGWYQTFPPANGLHNGFATGCGNAYGPYNFGDNTLGCPPFSKTYTLDAEATSSSSPRPRPPGPTPGSRTPARGPCPRSIRTPEGKWPGTTPARLTSTTTTRICTRRGR
jgi:hypothetical protein